MGIFALAFACAMCGAVVEAQQPIKTPKIGFLGSGPSSRPWHESFKREFRKLGYIDGKNVTFIHRFADTKYDRLPVLADELVSLKVDVIITPGSNDTGAAKKATKTIPIVFLGGLPVDPVEAGLVESLARPGGNVTGLSILSRELAGKRLELLKETVPKLARVAVLYDPALARVVALEMKELLPVAARALGVTLQSWEVRGAEDSTKYSARQISSAPTDSTFLGVR